ncbi:MAG: type III secretion inner membrane ring lipoprotein SctJ [Chlamydiia bacterium]|nr:type III secretion inner membrane ring lipoprotein SctJ [Chlamydiia bacterium]
MQKQIIRFLSLIALVILAGCESNQTIVNSIDERDANEILVYLASKGVEAQKVLAPSTGVGNAAPSNQYSITVASNQSVDAMAILNKAGLPRRKGTTLLELFAKSGLMSSTLEETVRYQAGLAEELRNTIRKIDGILDANVQISFPPTQTNMAPGATQPKITAAVYVKHQGVLEDPNSHLEIKIKRLLAGSVNGLSYDDVSVISDRSKFADITLSPTGEMIGPHTLQTHVGIWGLVMTQSSLSRFRLIFFTFIFLLLLLLAAVGWMVYSFYPQMRASLFKKRESQPELPPPSP